MGARTWRAWRRRTVVAAGAAMILAAPATAQFSDSYKFLEAVRKSDGAVVTGFVEAPGTTLINTRDRSTGETALHITVNRRDEVWTNYLLGHGARTDILTAGGRTPLMIAVERRFIEGIQLLLDARANVNQANSQGETALMRAVQMRDVPMVRLLMAKGADPAKRDSLTGMSARDYAQRDARIPGMLEALDAAGAAKPSAPIQGPGL